MCIKTSNSKANHFNQNSSKDHKNYKSDKQITETARLMDKSQTGPALYSAAGLEARRRPLWDHGATRSTSILFALRTVHGVHHEHLPGTDSLILPVQGTHIQSIYYAFDFNRSYGLGSGILGPKG